MVYANIMHTKRLLYFRTPSFPVWGGVRATWRATAKKRSPVCKTLVFVDFCGFCLRIGQYCYFKKKGYYVEHLVSKCNRDLHQRGYEENF